MSQRRSARGGRPARTDPTSPAPTSAVGGGACRLLPLLLLLTSLLVGAPPDARAQPRAQAVARSDVPVLTPPVERALLRLQEGWLQWTSALYGAEAERALGLVEELVGTAEQLGMDRLPDLAAGALIQAVQAAREGDVERAQLALAAAERFDPGRPEIAFAEAEVARQRGDWFGRLSGQMVGYLRAFATQDLRAPVLADLGLWGLVTLVVAGGLFLALLMATEGRAVLHDLHRALAGWMSGVPEPLVQTVLLVLLLWPLAVPWGPIWLVLYWSVLLWRHAAASQRVVLVGFWLLLGLVPWAAERTRTWMDLELSAPVRAMESLAEGRLYGGLLTDLSVLPALLPDSPAVAQLLGDLHVRFGQWDEARSRYEEVIEQEPDNIPALVDLGAYYFNRGDYGNAVSMFQRVTALEQESAAAHFNLSLAYAESYLYDESREALLEARRIDDLRVTEWLDRSEGERIVTLEGGLARRDEIQEALVRAGAPATETAQGLRVLRRVRSLLAVGLIVGLGLALLAGLRHLGPGRRSGRGGGAPPPRPATVLRGEGDSPLRRLVPGLVSSSRDRGLSAYLSVLFPAALLSALAAVIGRGFGYPVPWRYDPGDWFLLWLLLAGFGLLVAFRMSRALWSRG